MSPLVGTGGLAEVTNALPRALRVQGHDVRVVMPLYRAVAEEYRGRRVCDVLGHVNGEAVHGVLNEARVPGSDIPLYLVQHEGYYGRDYLYGDGAVEYPDNLARFTFFCRAVLDGLPKTGWRPDVVHCHDWHTALLPVYIKHECGNDPYWGGMPTVYTIHNLAYQGVHKAEELSVTGLGADVFHMECMEFWGGVNLMKGGIAFASQINVVSPQYAKEVLESRAFGMGLEGFLNRRRGDLSGIINGVDYSIWNPAKDEYIPAKYSVQDMAGKAVCKKAVRNMYGLPERDVPLIGMVTRVDPQKGVDLLIKAIPELIQNDLQLVVLGTGDPDLERGLAQAVRKGHDRARFDCRFHVPTSHKMMAGSDFFLMPSRFEPCGLGQMYAMAYGAIPIVRAVGGLIDTVTNTTKATLARHEATGLVFAPMTADALTRAVKRAVDLYADKAKLENVRQAAMAADWSWEVSSKAYVALYRKAMARP